MLPNWFWCPEHHVPSPCWAPCIFPRSWSSTQYTRNTQYLLSWNTGPEPRRHVSGDLNSWIPHTEKPVRRGGQKGLLFPSYYSTSIYWIYQLPDILPGQGIWQEPLKHVITDGLMQMEHSCMGRGMMTGIWQRTDSGSNPSSATHQLHDCGRIVETLMD